MLRYSLVAVLVVGLLVAATPALAATEAPGFGPQLQLQQMTKEQVRQQLREMHTELKGTCEQFQTRLSEQEHAQLEEHLLLMRRLSWADDFEPGQINSLALKLAAMVGQEADDDTLDGEDDDGIDEAGSGVLAIAARLHFMAGELDAAEQAYERAILRNRYRMELYQNYGETRAQNGENGVTAFVNGRQPEFDVPPIIRDGRTLIPVRAITEALGATVEWDSDTRTVTITRGDVVIVLRIADRTVTVNGEEIELDVPPGIMNSRTMVPIRFVSETLGAAVDWVGVGRVVIVNE